MAADRDSAGLTQWEGPTRGPGTVAHDARGLAGDEAAGGDKQEAKRGESDARRRRHCRETCPQHERGDAGKGQPQTCERRPRRADTLP